MTNSLRVWQPSSNDSLIPSLAVPFNGQTMTREKYEPLLLDRLEELISDDPKAAKATLTDSVENNPDLSQIASSTQPQDWPRQIMTSDQMQMRLNRIDWKKGQSASLEASEMPSLQQVVEAI